MKEASVNSLDIFAKHTSGNKKMNESEVMLWNTEI